MQKLANHTQLSVRNLQALLENLLQWSAAQSGSADTVSFDPEEVHLFETMQRNLDLLQDTAIAKGINWQLDLPENLKVYADANMLAFVIRNLLHNAIKFSGAGSTIQVSAAITGGGMAEVAVQDQGTGMTPETVASLFNQEQLAATTKGTANEKGTGLGLLLCRLFVERNGGFIWVSSVLGRGSRFWFTVPLTQGNSAPGAEQLAATTAVAG
jgi:two-component system, sensor histidine kinase LadS